LNTDRIPATVVTGFLGAGKTTLIRNLLRNSAGKRIAIIVNEFGDMGFDGALLEDCGDASCNPETVVELTNGCICCTVADDFVPTMEMLLARNPPPEHIVIETSGLALPQPLVRAFSWPAVKHRVTVDGVVTVVDASAVADGRFAPDLAMIAAAAEDPSRDHDPPIVELFEDQLRSADLIVMSKSDLLSEDALRDAAAAVRAEARPETRLVHADASGLPPSVLVGMGASAEDDMAARLSHHEMEGEAEHDHDDFVSFVVATPGFASAEAARDIVRRALALDGVLRIKGRVAVEGKAAPLVVQAVGGRVEIWFAPGLKASGLVVIGEKHMDEAAIRAVVDHAALKD
jgi:cobalamin biosynthesis protein CobW